MGLTKLSIDRMAYAKDGGAADYRWDNQLRGFGVRVYPSGLKAYVLAYRAPSGRKRFLLIGRHGELTVQQARQLAQQALARVREGHDPQADRQAKRAEMTFAELAERYLDHEKMRGKRSLKDDRQRLRDHILPVIGKRRLSEIDLRGLQDLQKRIVANTSNSTANRCSALVRRILNVAVDWSLIPSSPARSLKLLREPPPRDIVLSPDECRAVLQACRAEPNIHAGALFILAMRTGRRIGELLKLRWADVDLDRRRLTIHETKAGERQYVYLTAEAAELLRTLPHIASNPFVFAGKMPGKPLNFYRPAWTRILRRAGLAHFPPHGLRHNLASTLVAEGVPLETVGDLLGHKSSLTTRKYAHHRPEHLHRAADTFSKVIDLDRERRKRSA
jgi:integrase